MHGMTKNKWWYVSECGQVLSHMQSIVLYKQTNHQCGECENCQQVDYGMCKFCKDKQTGRQLWNVLILIHKKGRCLYIDGEIDA